MPSTDPGPGFQSGDVAVPNTVSPLGAAPVARASDLLGAHRTVDTIAERDAILSVLRDEGMTVWITQTGELYRLVGGVANSDWVFVSEDPAAAQVVETFTPLLGQTVFNLAFLPGASNTVEVYVNTAKYTQGVSYTVVGQVVTWLDNPFALDPADSVEIRYFQ